MNIINYKTFLVLSDLKSFSQAAKELNVVQSTVSSRIKELEQYYDTILFLRNHKHITLSESGQLLMPYIKNIVELDAQAKELLTKYDYQPIIRIGTMSSYYHTHLKSVISQMNQRLKLQFDHSDNLYKLLRLDQIDIACVSYLSPDYQPLATITEEVVLVGTTPDSFNQIVFVPITNPFNEWFHNSFKNKHIIMEHDNLLDAFEWAINNNACCCFPKN